MLFEVKMMSHHRHDAPAATSTRPAPRSSISAPGISLGSAVAIAQRAAGGDVCAAFLDRRGSVVTLAVRSGGDRSSPRCVTFIALDCASGAVLGSYKPGRQHHRFVN